MNKFLTNPWLSSILSGLLLGFSFAPSPTSWLVLVAFVPLLVYAEEEKKSWRVFLFALLAFFICHLVFYSTGFLVKTGLVNKLAIMAFLCSYAVPMALAFRVAHFIHKKIKSDLRLKLFAFLPIPLCWIAYEYLFTYAIHDLLPLQLLFAFNEHASWLQVVGITGPVPVTLYILFTNVLLAHFLLNRAESKQPLYLVLTLQVLFALGNMLAHEASPTEKFTVAAVQPVFNPYQHVDAMVMADRIRELEKLSYQCATASPKLITWPESAIQGVRIELDKLDSDVVIRYVMHVAEVVRTPILTGALVFKIYASAAEASPTARPLGDSSGYAYDVMNCALLVSPDKPVQVYCKNALIPFVEYVPGIFSDLQQLKFGLGDNYPSYGTIANDSLPEANGVRIAPFICSEILSLRYINTMLNKKPQVLALLSNEGWANKASTGEQFSSYLAAASAFSGIPSVKASNSGPSVSFDHEGQTLKKNKFGKPGIMITDLYVDRQSDNNEMPGMVTQVLIGLCLTGITFLATLRRNSHSFSN